MNSFEDRKKSFENKFAHDEELKFKVNAKRNKYLGQWVSKVLGHNEDDQKKYVQDLIKADFQEVGDEDVFRKIKEDLKNYNISEKDIRLKMNETLENAKKDFA